MNQPPITKNVAVSISLINLFIFILNLFEEILKFRKQKLPLSLLALCSVISYLKKPINVRRLSPSSHSLKFKRLIIYVKHIFESLQVVSRN